MERVHSNVDIAKAGAVGSLGAAARVVGCGLLIALCCRISIHTRGYGTVSVLWISSGVLAGILLTSARSSWTGYIAAALAANVLIRAISGDAWYLVAGRGLASTIDACLVAYLILQYAGDVRNPANIRRISRVAVASTLFACAVSGLLAATSEWCFDGSSFLPLLATWFASHTLGIVIFATLTVVARNQGLRLLGRQGHRTDLAFSTALTALVCFWVFTQAHYPLLFIIYPPLLLGAFRHRFAGVVFGVSLTAVISIAETLSGRGPLFLIPHAGVTERVLLLQLFIASTCLLALPVAVVLTDRGALLKTLRESEHRYRMLAEYSRDLVVRLGRDGNGLYVSPSAKEIFGWDLDRFANQRMDLMHPDDVKPLAHAMKKLFAEGGTATITYRQRHRDGHYLWIEANARRVPGEHGGPPEIIYVGRDVTRRIETEEALRQNQRRLRAITDNLPALVVHVDTRLRYTFANAKAGMVLGMDPAQIVGKLIRDVLQPKYYDEIIGPVEAALRGEASEFGIERMIGKERFHYQTSIVPDIETDGRVVGFYVMSSDVTQLHRTEQELKKLARYDSLTGLANRFHFNEHIGMVLARHRRSERPLAVLYMDIDRFKQINDSLGHATGDEVLREFAQRLTGTLRETDFEARLGGDEFVVLVEDTDTPEAPESIARKMIDALHRPFVTSAGELRVTTSIGIGYCSSGVTDSETLLNTADKALYAAKAAGRDTWRMALVEDGNDLAKV